MTLKISSVLMLCEDIPQGEGTLQIPKGTCGKVVAIQGDFVHVELPVGIVRVVNKSRIHSNMNAIFGYYFLEEKSAELQNNASDMVHVETVSDTTPVQEPGETTDRIVS